MLRPALFPLLLLLCSCGSTSPRAEVPSTSALAWNEYGAAPFERARVEGKIVMLSVQAGWCHWCHVMNETTLRDREVQRTLGEHFVVVRAEADARPDLLERYRRFGWPATVFFGPDGTEILALRGHRTIPRFRAILRDVMEAAREGRTLASQEDSGERAPEDLAELRTTLIARLDAMYDEEQDGWGRSQRYPLAAPVQHAFFRAAVRGQPEWRARALRTLERYAQLIDPVWGGVYQYSEAGVWGRPHYEKIVSVQAGAIRVFAEAYRASGDRRWLARAEDVRRYVREHLRAEDGAFYTSQDADLGTHGEALRMPGARYYALGDGERRALGEPHVDTNVYAATNGMLIEALAELSIASGDAMPLGEAIAAAERIERTHRRESGLFAHGAHDAEIFHLADQALMLEGFLALHQASAQPRWLDHATALADAVLERLRDGESGGFFAHTEDPDAAFVFRERLIPIEHNARMARALMTIARLRHEDRYHEAALAALRACARPDDLRALGRMIGEYVLALEMIDSSYVLLSVVGPDDEQTAALHRAALAFYDPVRLVELGRPGASRYPYPGEPAVYMCTSESCSMPITDPARVTQAARAFLSR
jgi:uncharacterized protein